MAAVEPARVGEEKRRARFRFDRAFEASIAATLSTEPGGGGQVQVQVLGTEHGRDGAVHWLSRLVIGGPATDEQGREVATVADVRARAYDWRKGLGSRQARDAMHRRLGNPPPTPRQRPRGDEPYARAAST